MAAGGARIARRPKELPFSDPLANFQIGQFVEMFVLGIDPHRKPGVFGRVAQVDLVPDQAAAGVFVDHFAVGDGDYRATDGGGNVRPTVIPGVRIASPQTAVVTGRAGKMGFNFQAFGIFRIDRA